MRKVTPFNKAISCLFVFLLFISCGKEISSDLALDTQMIPCLHEWLDKQVASTNVARTERIRAIKSNLDFSAARSQKINAEEELITIPLKPAFLTNVNKGKNRSNHLLLFLKNGTIYHANIIQYISREGEAISRMPVHATFAVFNDRMEKADGHFAVLSIFDHFFYEVAFKDGVQVTHMTTRKREPDPVAVNATGNRCTAWYLVTTTYYPDGTTETNWEYLYTSCGGCQPNELCDELGGEGAGGLSIAVIAQESWVVEAAGAWAVRSTESFTGIKNEKEERGGHFTGMTHNRSDMHAAGVTGAKMKWDEAGVITNAEGYKAVCLISGWVSCESRPEDSWGYFVPGRDKTFFFNHLNWH